MADDRDYEEDDDRWDDLTQTNTETETFLSLSEVMVRTPMTIGSKIQAVEASLKAKATSAWPKRQFMGGVDDDDERMKEFIEELEQEVEKVKQEKRAREATLSTIDEPWSCSGEYESSVAVCRFHDWGVSEAKSCYAERVEPFVDTREKIWHVYRIDFVEADSSTAWFVGATNYAQDDLLMILNRMVTGEAPRRVTDAEGASEFSKYTLLLQAGHSRYRRLLNLSFFRFQVLKEESETLNKTRFLSRQDQGGVEAFAIEAQKAWFTSGLVSKAKGGLNYWDPHKNRIHAKWGVSLKYLRSLFDRDDKELFFKTIQMAFDTTLKPRAHQHVTFIDLMRKTLPQFVNEDVDWFVSPSCHHCRWSRMIFEGGISPMAKVPAPIVKGDRFVYIDLFVQ